MADRTLVVARLREIGDLLDLAGKDAFRARAYANGARALEASRLTIDELLEGGRLLALPGIGRGLAKIIEEIHATGDSGLARELRRGLPTDAVAMARATGLGLAPLRVVHEALGVSSLHELRAAAEDGRLLRVKGFGHKKVGKVLASIARGPTRAPGDDAAGTVLLHEALDVAASLEDMLLATEAIHRVRLVGSVRRRVELSRDIDLVLVAPDTGAALEAATRLARVAVVDALSREERRVRVRLGDGMPVDFVACEAPEVGITLVRETGSVAHVAALEARALGRGTTLEAIARGGPGEASIYAALGLAFVTPELREGQGEIEEAARGFAEGRDPWDDLVRETDVRGLVHCHTTWSDGRSSIEEMAAAAKAWGASYLTITDHSAAAHYAGGLDRERLVRQADEIAAAEEKVGIQILRGTEADILADGRIDCPEDLFERLDVVVASLHARHKQDEDEMTRRLVRAMQAPVFKIWGHPLGRLVRSRPPVACRVEEVLDALAASRGAIEINGDPRRLDLPPEWIRAARARGIPFVLSVDAHAVADFRNVRWATAMARRAGVRRSEVLNVKSAAAFARAVRPAPERRAA